MVIPDGYFPWQFTLPQVWPPGAGNPFQTMMNDNGATSHGGFTEAKTADPSDALHGHLYTGVVTPDKATTGLHKVDPDMKTSTKIGTDVKLESQIHSLEYFEYGGENCVACAIPDEDCVLIVRATDGVVIGTPLEAPVGTEFSTGHKHIDVNTYFLAAHPFKPSDVVFMDDYLYVANGYCGLADGEGIVMRAHKVGPGWVWDANATTQGGVIHGLFTSVTYDIGTIWGADISDKEIKRFNGDLTGTPAKLEILNGPADVEYCNIAQVDLDHFVFSTYKRGGVMDPDIHPFYIYSTAAGPNEKSIVSTIRPYEDGIIEVPGLWASHCVWPHWYDGQRYLLINGAPGFAVLEQVWCDEEEEQAGAAAAAAAPAADDPRGSKRGKGRPADPRDTKKVRT
mmetsp:Transcript_16147/g.41880  ORF Transcript_16147/g.41880 Transcript_16147/m.41880 type:complete len:396 (-) Transcript_16147:184-1371(-)